MNPILIADKSKDMVFAVINVASRMYYVANLLKYKTLIKRNLKFKNIHKGETCYILGNGPSLSELDVGLLEGKNIITVNAMVGTPMFDELKPMYHCLLDRAVFKKAKTEFVNRVRSTDTTFFFHRKIVDEIGIFDNTYYTFGTLMPTSKKLQLDLTKNTSTFINVLPYSIMIAIYMGFSKIVLLGCDFSFFASRKNAHFYEKNKDVKREETLFQDLFGSAIACQQYQYLFDYAKEKNIILLNATPNSFLDVIPKVNLQETL